MLINKKPIEKQNFRIKEFFYDSAREGLFDLLNNMRKEGLIERILVPGYIGWSPKEGSGIYDAINKIDNLSVIYYQMDKELNIVIKDLMEKMEDLQKQKFAVLIINYFGFIDKNICKLYSKIKKLNGWIIEDNAHAFFTRIYSDFRHVDATFFSFHKMFPFINGGSIKILDERLKKLKYKGKAQCPTTNNPWKYNIPKIMFIRRRNYMKLDILVKEKRNYNLFEPLRKDINREIIPQSYPIIIKCGDRDRIYQLMNDNGYGVISLYHTLIFPLNNIKYSEATYLSKRILNLPVHQDVEQDYYENMIKYLHKSCLENK